MNIDLRNLFGALVVPALAIAYALYALWEQGEEFYREDTTQYMMVLIVPVLVLAGVVILQSLVEAWRAGRRAAREGGAAAEPGEEAQDAPPDRGRWLRPGLLVAAAIVLVLALDAIGYLVAFTLFVVAVLLAMGVRSPWRIGAITVGTMVVVHVVFIEILDQPLPRGWLEALSG